jgi:Tol biopolymer transport system component
MIGQEVGPYLVVEKIGAGGMGEVYKARDSRLQRHVAVKILPPAFAADPERLARFAREGQVLASLNHPNIAQIYGVEEHAGATAIVMELIEGQTLADMIAQHGPVTTIKGSHASRLDIDRVAIGRQLADALEAAHEQGIIHRDLKPQNIILRADGTLKVLDFGLAKALDSNQVDERLDNSPTITNAATQAGVLLGTAAYMAPEQVKGRQADRRADIWAYGVVMFELFTGVMAFGAATVAETLARVIERDPDWSKLPPDTPPAVVRLLHRTLAKDPKRRLQSIGDARLELDDAFVGTTATASAPSWSARAIKMAGILAALLAAAALGALSARTLWDRWDTTATPAVRAAIALTPGTYLDGGGPPVLAFSPDGSTLAFVARDALDVPALYVRALGAEAATLVPGSETVEGPFFSPDGRSVGFAVGVSMYGVHPPELRKYSLDTGITESITRLDDYFGGVWRGDGSIVFINRNAGGLWTVDSAGGEARQIVGRVAVDGEEIAAPLAWPASIPNSPWLLVTRATSSPVGQLMAVNLESKQSLSLGIEGTAPQVLSNGFLVYANPAAAVMAVRFDADAMRVTGIPTAVMPEIAFTRGNVPAFAVAANGTLAFAPGFLRFSRREPMQLIRVSRTGHVSPLPFEPDLLGRGFQLSPDGSRLAVSTWDTARWIYDLRRGTRLRQPHGLVANVFTLSWHPQGRQLAVGGPLINSGAWGVLIDPLDGSPNRETLFEEQDVEAHTAGWLPDGQTHVGWRTGSADTLFVRSADGSSRTLVAESGTIASATVSRDGRWVAYDSTTAGPYHVYVTSIASGGRVQVSAKEATAPRWSHDGRQLFFRSGRSFYAVDVTSTADGIDFVNQRKLFDADIAREYDVAPSGDVYTMLPAPDLAYQRFIQLRTRWFDEVERVANR